MLQFPREKIDRFCIDIYFVLRWSCDGDAEDSPGGGGIILLTSDCPAQWEGVGTMSYKTYLAHSESIERFFDAHRAEIMASIRNGYCDYFDPDMTERLESGRYFELMTGARVRWEIDLFQSYREAAPMGGFSIARSEGVPPLENPLLVTHTSRLFDHSASAKAGIDRAIRVAKSDGRPVVYLMSDDGMDDFSWYAQDREPDYAVSSSNGDHRLPLSGGRFSLGGGYFSLCMDRTLDAFMRSMRSMRSRLRVDLIMDGIYVEKNLFLANSTSQADSEWLMETANYPTLATVFSHVSNRTFLTGVSSIVKMKEGRQVGVEIYLGGRRMYKTKGRKAKWVEVHFQN